jgi:hypothetical protein
METIDKISYEYWEEEIKTIIIGSLLIPSGDAQAMIEAQSFIMSQSWGKGLTAQETANKIMES